MLSQSILSFVAYLNRGSLRHTFATSSEPLFVEYL